MTTGDIIQLVGIILSTIIGILSLIVGICNYSIIKTIKNTITHSEKKRTSQKAIAKNGSNSIQVGGNINQWEK